MTAIERLDANDTINALSAAARERLVAVVDAALGEVFPALAVTMVQNGAVRLNAAWGSVENERTRPGTLFDLASVTKLFTTSAFLSLVSEGKVKLDTPLVEVIPEFGGLPRPVDGGIDPHSKQPLPMAADALTDPVDPAHITLWHLLTHTSGLAPWRDVYNRAGAAPGEPVHGGMPDRTDRWKRAVEALCGYPFVGPISKTVRYSDLGLMLLGEATRRLDGADDLAEVIAARVTRPLGLTTTVFNPVTEHGIAREGIAPTELDPDWRGRRVWGEVHDENACGVGGVAGHAGLFSTARDVAAFGEAWLRRDSRLGIDPALMDDAVRVHVDDEGQRRGLGWVIRALEDSSASERFSEKTYGHTGFTGTTLWIDPERELVVSCLSNRVFPGRHKEGIHAFRRALHALLAEVADGL